MKIPVQKECLKCFACGNSERFVQINDYEANLITTSFDHVRLLHAEVSEYRCWICDRRVEPIKIKKLGGNVY